MTGTGEAVATGVPGARERKGSGPAGRAGGVPPRHEAPPEARLAVVDALPKHAVPPETFLAIAGARGGPQAVRLLRAGQLSKRMLLLLALGRAEPRDEGYRRAFDELCTLQRTDPERWEEVMFQPELDAWVTDRLNESWHGTAAALDGLGEFLRADAGVVLDLECDGLRWRPLIDHLGPRRVDYGRPPVGPLSAAELRLWEQKLAAAWEILVRRHRRHAEAVAACVSVVVPLLPAPGGEAASAAARRAYGAVATSLPADPVLLALALVHEFLHIQLGALLDLVPLHRPNGPAIYHAPWRPDLRPAGALLQGTYAHLGVASFWCAEAVAGVSEPARAEREFTLWRTHTLTAAGILLECGELTGHGTEFTEELARSVRELGA
ncbi:HEXXH motif-containing putative peptide modification protein [Kitasatospora sp. NPDC096128]|uniref:aKG-HExxH-type peptide beta-hydroxylase n=1 Tax=Kitasatospora sp. NPDC096128 TaxID=3155547 RepID=UPI00332EFD55